jgi:tripartite-type tricarboxylate transporter receptor subunit TctC
MYSRGAVAIVIASVTLLAGPATAETYPTRTIRLIVPYAPGGATDVVGRRVGQRLSEVVGQSVVVENRPGGMENIGVRTCTDAAPDGYTLCLPTQQSIVYNGLTMRQMPFDPSRELVPIINLYSSMSVVAINSEYGVRSIDELIRFAKTRRGALNYGAFSYPLEYFIEKLNKENGIDLVKVPFRSGTELANAMLANSTPIGGLGVSNIVSYLESGRMIGLAVNSYERMVLFPDIPTVNELRPGEKYPPAWFGSLRRQERRARSWKRSPTSPERFSLRPASATRPSDLPARSWTISENSSRRIAQSPSGSSRIWEWNPNDFGSFDSANRGRR